MEKWIKRNHRHDNRGRSELRPPYPAASETNANSVPEWEKKFCYVVGLIPWRKVLDTKSYASCYPDVMNWDDSEAKDTFHSAKMRFWAQMNGLCIDDAPLPDPDTYIDQIDWNTSDDSDLYKDLDRAFLTSTEGKATEVSTAGVVDISVLFQNTQWQDHGTTWDAGGNWDAEGWGKHESGGWGAVDATHDKPEILEGAAHPWNSGPNKRNGPVNNISWGRRNDNAWGWGRPEKLYSAANPHNMVYPNDGNFQHRGAVKNNGWTMSGNNSWGRNYPPKSFKETKVWVKSSSQHKGGGAARECGKYGDHSWNNNQHRNDTYNIRENQYWGNRGDRKRESPNNYATRSKSPWFHRMDYQRHDQHEAVQPWRNRQSMQQSGSSFRPS